MASKLQEYRRMSEEAQRQLTGSLERWQSFLATASRLYKYPYHEQVMIHAQRPDATACAEFDVWNNTMRRYVRRGSKGIALIDTSGDRERLRYVFDVSDTGTRPNSRSLNLWELREEHIPAVSSMLEKTMAFRQAKALLFSLKLWLLSWRGNTGRTTAGTSSASLRILFWKSMMNSTSELPSGMPPRSVSVIP